MERPTPKPIERVVPEHKFIVSKTDPRGVITYANEVFIEVSGALSKNYSFIYHPL